MTISHDQGGAAGVFPWPRANPLGMSLSANTFTVPVNPAAVPIETLTQKLRTAAETNANSIVLYARQNPDLQKLLNNYEVNNTFFLGQTSCLLLVVVGAFATGR